MAAPRIMLGSCLNPFDNACGFGLHNRIMVSFDYIVEIPSLFGWQ